MAAPAVTRAGIGVNTAIFSVINCALFRKLTYTDPARLTDVWVQNLKRAYLV